MGASDWANWATSLRSSPAITTLLNAIPSCSLAQRKCILTCSRVQPDSLSPTSRFYKAFSRELQSRIYYTFYLDRMKTSHVHTLEDLLSPCVQISSPFIYSILSASARMAPWESYDEVLDVRNATILKEIKAATDPPTNADIDWTPLFTTDSSERHTRMYWNLPLNAPLHRDIHILFVRARSLLTGRIFYPETSKKSIGEEAKRECDAFTLGPYGDAIDRRRVECLEDVELVYHLTGIELTGPVEMRVAWKYNEIKPRVYYAQGPTTYSRSKFVQPIFNVILDVFDVVHRYNRYSLPSDAFLGLFDLLIIYDYSSFTSRLTAIKSFTRELARFFGDARVILVDTWQGPISRTLESLLVEYTELCNESAVFDAHRVLQEECPYLLDHVCGMLGIPGNISSCTLLHGIHLCILLESLLRGRCVGDDALGKLVNGRDPEVKRQFLEGVNNLGEVAEDKFETWSYEDDYDDSGWHYTKTPITRIDAAIVTGKSLVFPSIASLINLSDEYHTVTHGTLHVRRKKFISQWSRYLDRLIIQYPELQDYEKKLLVAFQRNAYRRLGLGSGGYRWFDDEGRVGIIAPCELYEDDFSLEWRQRTIDKMGGLIVRVPDFNSVERSVMGFACESVDTVLSKRIMLMERLGYLESRMNYVDCCLQDLPKSISLSIVSMNYRPVYNVVVLKDFPDWYNTLQYLELLSPHERLSVVKSM